MRKPEPVLHDSQTIRLKIRRNEDGDWIFTMPYRLQPDFEEYARELRLPWRAGPDVTNEGRGNIIAGGISPADMRETIGHFLDGIGDVDLVF